MPDERITAKGFGLGRFLVRLALLLIIVLAGLWLFRFPIAENVLARELKKRNIDATYEIEDLGFGAQVLKNVKIGPAASPDLAIKKVKVGLDYTLGIPSLGLITVEGARLSGKVSDKGISFGSLDKLIFDKKKPDEGMPDLDLKLTDFRASITSPYGSLGAALEGEGNLQDGFDGRLALSGPNFAASSCQAHATKASGRIYTSSQVYRFEGPIRLQNLACEEGNVRIKSGGIDAVVSVAPDFSTIGMSGPAELLEIASGESFAGRVGGPIKLEWKNKELQSEIKLSVQNLRHAGASVQMAEANIWSKIYNGVAGGYEILADFRGHGVDLASLLGPDFSHNLSAAKEAVAGSMLSPLISQFAFATERNLRDLSLNGKFFYKVEDGAGSLNVPEVLVKNNDGEVFLTLSKIDVLTPSKSVLNLSGNAHFGGAGFPTIEARANNDSKGRMAFFVSIPPYTSSYGRFSLPALALKQTANGGFSFGGEILASGLIPGGAVQNLRLPFNGVWQKTVGLSLLPTCSNISFDGLAMGEISLGRQELRICPPAGKAVVSGQGANMAVNALLPSINLTGAMAGEQFSLRSGGISLGWPGEVRLRDLAFAMGQNSAAFSEISGRVDGGGIARGTFSGANVSSGLMPLGFENGAGEWHYAGGTFALNNTAITVKDGVSPERFFPLSVAGANLTYKDGNVLGAATLFAPDKTHELSALSFRHNVNSGKGAMDIGVNGLLFDKSLQPDQISALFKGVIANVGGAVNGKGQIQWTDKGVTSGGEFASDGLDFAVGFGPVRGARGKVAFSDLINLTTASPQVIQIDSINPGIEVLNGKLGFVLRDGQYLKVTGGEWPFLGGKLSLRPADLDLNATESWKYVLDVENIDASEFVQSMDMNNVSASGKFDGSLPLVFDAAGNGFIKEGVLTSRGEGGNLSYVGELSYKDLSAISNYTFSLLRSLDFSKLEVGINGPLTGDILSSLKFSGVRQGPGTKRNFITRQLEDLPLQFNMKIVAPFYQLMTGLKSLYDPTAIRDPREIGLINADGSKKIRTKAAPTIIAPPQSQLPQTLPQSKSSVQGGESETMP